MEETTIENVDNASSNIENCKNKHKKSVTFFEYDFINLKDSDLILFNPNLKLFELLTQQTYPLGSDSFKINHGYDYFAFFKRLGKIEYIIIQHIDEKVIVGTTCAILRHYVTKSKKTNGIIKRKSVPYWYFCDLKIMPAHRGKNLTCKLFNAMYKRFEEISDRGFMISMDPDSHFIIKLVQKMDQIRNTPPEAMAKTIRLRIYNVTYAKMLELEPILKSYMGDISYLSLVGIKDLILTSTNKVIPIYHLQHGFLKNADCLSLNELPKNATIMFCVPELSESSNEDVPNLKDKLDSLGFITDITATIISWNMKNFNWQSILTSDI